MRWDNICFQVHCVALDNTDMEGEGRAKMRNEDVMKEK
jgi:hypothetical protein